MGDRAVEFKFSRDDYLGEITFANKVRYDINIIAFNHAQNLSKARFLFPKAAIDFRKKPAPNNLVRMLKGGRARVRIYGGAMAYQHQ